MKYLVKFDCEFDGSDGQVNREIYEEYDSRKELVIGVCSFSSRHEYYSLIEINSVIYFINMEFVCEDIIPKIIEKYKNSDVFSLSEEEFNREIRNINIQIANFQIQLEKDTEFLSDKGIEQRIIIINKLIHIKCNLEKEKQNWLKEKQQFEEDLKEIKNV